MNQFTNFADILVIDKLNSPVDLFEDTNWKRETMLANSAMNKEQRFIAIQHYVSALEIAKNFFTQYQKEKSAPDSIIPILVVSFLNLSEFWADQGIEENERKCLIESFDFLVEKHQLFDLSERLKSQVSHGLGKIYSELVTCLREMGDFNTLEEKKKIFMEL